MHAFSSETGGGGMVKTIACLYVEVRVISILKIATIDLPIFCKFSEIEINYQKR